MSRHWMRGAAENLVRATRHPILTGRQWRWSRARRRNTLDLSGYLTPVQVCPGGCEFRELARRDLLAKTRLLGRAALHVSFTFETTNCPECGSRLARRCIRCRHEIFGPVEDRCQFCGLPQPWATERRAGAERADVRTWRQSQEEGTERLARKANDPALPLYRAPGRGNLWIIDADISQLDVDAVVSNDDVDGRMWAQVARAIKRAAGEGIERLAQEGRPFKLGQAWWTSAGGLEHMKGIIHVAALTRRGESHLETVRECLVAALGVATEKEYKSLGVAAIGSGPLAIDPVDWYRAFAELAIEHLGTRPLAGRGSPPELDIVLVLFEPPDFSAELATVREAVFSAWKSAEEPTEGTPEWKPLGPWRNLAMRFSASERA
jgi:O-acetyl-ADP-ribose deacetylase